MSFEIYKKDTLKFEVEGSTIELDVTRLTATESLQFNSKISRMDPELSSVESQEALVLLYMDLLSSIVDNIRGISGKFVWPEDRDERRKVLDAAGFDFVFTAALAYKESGKVKESEEGK